MSPSTSKKERNLLPLSPMMAGGEILLVRTSIYNMRNSERLKTAAGLPAQPTQGFLALSISVAILYSRPNGGSLRP